MARVCLSVRRSSPLSVAWGVALANAVAGGVQNAEDSSLALIECKAPEDVLDGTLANAKLEAEELVAPVEDEARKARIGHLEDLLVVFDDLYNDVKASPSKTLWSDKLEELRTMFVTTKGQMEDVKQPKMEAAMKKLGGGELVQDGELTGAAKEAMAIALEEAKTDEAEAIKALVQCARGADAGAARLITQGTVASEHLFDLHTWSAKLMQLQQSIKREIDSLQGKEEADPSFIDDSITATRSSSLSASASEESASAASNSASAAF